MIVSDFARQYILTALWATVGDGESDITVDHCVEDLAPSALKRMCDEADGFHAAYATDLASHEDATQGAHDLWLTRNGHGAGFWDGDWPEPQASRLTAAAKALDYRDLYEGDDGMIYMVGGKS